MTIISGALVVLTALLWGPWLPPAEEGSTTGPPEGSAHDALRAVLLFNDEFPWPVNPFGHVYMFSSEGGVRPQDYPPAGNTGGARPTFRYWEGNHGGVPLVQQTVRLELEGLTDEPVLVTRIDLDVVEEGPPLSGWFVAPDAGSGATVRYFEANLDCAQPILVPMGGNLAARKDPTTALDLQVSQLDKEQLEITAYSPRRYVRWALNITYVFDGDVHTLVVKDPRLEVTAPSPANRAFAAPIKEGALVRVPYADPTAADMADGQRYAASLCASG